MRSKTLGLAVSGVLAVGAFAFGGTHHAFADCSATGPYVGSQDITSGKTPTAAAGVCVNQGGTGGNAEVGVNPSAGVIYSPAGGTITGVPGAYLYIDGQNTNPPVNGNTADQGYVGVSDYESGSSTPQPNDAPCQTTTTGGDSNSGGSVGVDPLFFPAGSNGCGSAVSPIVGEGANGEIFINSSPTGLFLVAPVACGNFSGNDPGSTSRDGCWEP